MKPIFVRAISALVAVLILAALVVYGGTNAMRFLVLGVVILATREGMRILFNQVRSQRLGWIFAVFSVSLFCFGVYRFDLAALAYSVVFVVFFSISLFLQQKFTDLEKLSQYQARGILGFFYLALLPTFAVKLLDFDHGIVWFLGLLVFVFAGDTFAYLVGSRFGKRPLMPAVSPKKSLEGSFGGLAGSALGAAILHQFLPHVPMITLIGLSLLVGFSGQMGDPFESLLKRVANQKDSGSLMPGHGGILDRIDGVLFAAPIMYAGVSLLENAF